MEVLDFAQALIASISDVELFTLSEESSRRIFVVVLAPPTVPKQITTVRLTAGIAQFLPCSPDTNLPVSWSFSGVVLQPGPRHLLLSQGLVVTPSSTDGGLYSCDTVEDVHGREHRRAVVRYLVELHGRHGVTRMQEVAIGVSAACGALGLHFMYRRCRRKVQSHVGCSNSGTDAGHEGTMATGMEEGPKQNNENRFIVR